MIKQSTDAKGRRLTFALPTEALPGPVSVVGTFNDWTPGSHVLRRRSNGMSSASVTVPAGTTVHFRYLADGGAWFDDTEADAVTAEGSFVSV
ncbi:isoamylase early set domain-containing protein [Actinotalea sp. M2MS4P-6]|uniref:isoamylase early set domain-containing protein n=1 Tax=Actinotalea sp. M2MS4P-6 TaxID=2983762 RepID=UPI0021E42426|nr:isoamylase early set domain-containing protein [Actinotalea sp. M2MS4P-6]MCV2394654.1 isoamylase early set domain-containing protein [Actinotalea sp. M2MS4P-6]